MSSNKKMPSPVLNNMVFILRPKSSALNTLKIIQKEKIQPTNVTFKF